MSSVGYVVPVSDILDASDDTTLFLCHQPLVLCQGYICQKLGGKSGDQLLKQVVEGGLWVSAQAAMDG
jgi:hypothetical protein